MDFLNYTDWQDTADTLHMLLQMSGKVKLLYRAKRPEWAAYQAISHPGRDFDGNRS